MLEDAAMNTWEDQNQADLRLLVGLIEKIRNIVKKGGGRAILKGRLLDSLRKLEAQ
jgi:hypothetical protein